MYLTDVDARIASSFSYKSLDDLVEACVDFYRKSSEKRVASSGVRERRRQLAGHVRKFHSECGTLTPGVEEAVGKLEGGSCLVLMTAHQPNLFAYSGVLRKATLTQVLAEKLSERLGLPVVSFFGVADHDFTDDRWVRSALLPDVDRRDGVVELRVDLPSRTMLSRSPKLSRKVLDDLHSEISAWLSRKIGSLDRLCKSLRFECNPKSFGLAENLENFWKLVEEAYSRAGSHSDFNAFVMSKIVNEVWGYGTVFARFSECQQIFEEGFSFLLSHFEDYSRYVKEATLSLTGIKGGVYAQEYKTVPFWYHCDCGSKARLIAEFEDESFVGRGSCLGCEKEYSIDFGSRKEPEISGVLSRISTRSLSMPLVFFDGLGVCCYVGGIGGQEYLWEARHVAEHLGMSFPPVVVWRPLDVYFGVGQLDALMRFRMFSGTFDFSKYAAVVAELRKKVDNIEGEIKWLARKQKNVADDAGLGKEEKIEKIKAISIRQTSIRKETGFPLLVRDLKILGNVGSVLKLFPCIVDFAVNVGLKATSEQWIESLKNNADLSMDVRLRTVLEVIVQQIQPGFQLR